MFQPSTLTRPWRAWRRGASRTTAVAALGTGILLGAVAGTGGTSLSAVQTACTPGLASIVSQPATGYRYYRGSIRSFDCTPIVFNLFEPLGASSANPVYTILEGPGWGGAGSTSPDSSLISANYAELTWDPRGFGQSGGVAEVDSPEAEGRDVSALIDYVLTNRPEIATDNATGVGQPAYTNDSSSSNTVNQPAVGMTGVSYGGGIEFATAAFDNRVKAMVPGWAWNNLDYSLFPGGVVKLGWDELLFGAGLAESTASHGQGDIQGISSGTIGGTGGVQTGGFDPNIDEAELKGAALGYPDQQTLAWFAQRSMIAYGAGPAGHVPAIPTLLEQGTVDTLFNLSEAWANRDMIATAHPGVPVKMIAFCGGHVSCPTGAAPSGAGYSDTASATNAIAPGQSASTFNENQMIHWFDVYLRGHDVFGAQASDTLAPVIYQDQNGNWFAASNFPTVGAPGAASFTTAPVSGTLISHGVPTGVGPLGLDAAVTDGATAANDPGQVTVPVFTAGSHDVHVVGEPHINLNVTVNGTSTNLFFRLIDKATGEVVDLQTAALKLDNLDLVDNAAHPNLPPSAQTVSLDMVGVAYDLPAGDTLELQVSTSTLSFEGNRGTSVVALNGTVQVPSF